MNKLGNIGRARGETVAKPKTESPSPLGPAELARTLFALADPIRLRMTYLMLHREVTSQQCARVLARGPSVVYRHLACLRGGNLLARRRRGRITYYSVRPGLSSTESDVLRLVFDSLQAHSGLLQADIDVLDSLSMTYSGRVQLIGRPACCSTATESLPAIPNAGRILENIQAGSRSLFSESVDGQFESTAPPYPPMWRNAQYEKLESMIEAGNVYSQAD
jgi:DNA-binding transcriptional ArsR family regulator